MTCTSVDFSRRNCIKKEKITYKLVNDIQTTSVITVLATTEYDTRF